MGAGKARSCCARLLGLHEFADAVDKKQTGHPPVAEIAVEVGIVDGRPAKGARCHLLPGSESVNFVEQRLNRRVQVHNEETIGLFL